MVNIPNQPIPKPGPLWPLFKGRFEQENPETNEV